MLMPLNPTKLLLKVFYDEMFKPQSFLCSIIGIYLEKLPSSCILYLYFVNPLHFKIINKELSETNMGQIVPLGDYFRHLHSK